MNHNDEAVRQWQADLAQLRWHIELAATASSRPATTRGELKLRKGEEVFWEAEGATMVEVADTLNLFEPVHNVYSPIRKSGGYVDLARQPGSERDTGHVVVTTERVFFDGAKSNREWAYSQLTGLAHGSRNAITMMRVANRQRLSGLVLDGPHAAAFQFYLGLALATHRGDRAGFVAHLTSLEAHYAARPPTPPGIPASPLMPTPAGPHLPGRRATIATVVFGRPGSSILRKVAPTFAATMLAFCFGAVLSAPTAKDPSTSSAALNAAQPTSAAALPSSAPPSSAVAELSPSPTSAPALPVPTPTTKAPKPPATTSKAPPSTCGAPPNPFGYTFCSGSTITDPPADFCSYFNCIDNFWKSTNGYVIECEDHMFSHSGGRSGSCSYHGGNARTLRK